MPNQIIRIRDAYVTHASINAHGSVFIRTTNAAIDAREFRDTEIETYVAAIRAQLDSDAVATWPDPTRPVFAGPPYCEPFSRE